MTPKTQYNKRWEAAHRDKYLAHKAVENALVIGRLTGQPCAQCGSLERVQAHHDDYARRLDVVWLCPVHHRERHKELKELGGPKRGTAEKKMPWRFRKLTVEQRAEIFTSDCSWAALARKFGVSESAIYWHRKHRQ